MSTRDLAIESEHHGSVVPSTFANRGTLCGQSHAYLTWQLFTIRKAIEGNMCEIRPMAEADRVRCSSLSKATRTNSWESVEKSFYPREKFEEELLLYSPESLAKYMNSPSMFSFVAIDGEEVCGCALGKIDTDTGIADIGWIFVADKRRGRGIAGKLIEAASNKASDSGCHKIIAFTMKDLPDANAMYRRYGFEMEGDLRRHWMKIDFVQYGKLL